MRTDTKAPKGLAAGLTAAILAAELYDAALPEHSPHAEPALPDPARRAVAGGGSLKGRPVTWLNDRGELVQWVNERDELVEWVANGRPAELAGLEVPLASIL